jgi:hypothetical protein
LSQERSGKNISVTSLLSLQTFEVRGTGWLTAALRAVPD